MAEAMTFNIPMLNAGTVGLAIFPLHLLLRSVIRLCFGRDY
jgi:hypothetical protein